MRHDETQERLRLRAMIDDTEAELASQPWWHDRRRVPRGRRNTIQSLLNNMRLLVNHDQLSEESIARLLGKARQLDLGQAEKYHIAGQSVGFKTPRGYKIRWINVPGTLDPGEASRLAGESETARRWALDGYREYGISPILKPLKPGAPRHDPEPTVDPAPAP